MKKYFISVVCLMCAVMVIVSVARAQDSDMKNHEEQWKQLNAEVMKAINTGRYQDGTPIAERAYQYALKNLGKTHPNTLTSINNLALLYESQGRYGEAELFYKDVLQLSKKVLGKEHPDTLISINNLAELYREQGRYEEAEPLYNEALQLHEKVLGKEHPNTLTSINNLALLYKSQGHYREAEPLYKKALQVREKVLGKEHPDTLSSIINLASLYQSQGHYGEAEPLMKRALQLHKKIFGDEHPNTLTFISNLAGLYKSQKRYGEAESLYKEILYLREKVLGKEHPDTLNSLGSLAVLYYRQGRYGEAEPLMKRALQLHEKVLGREHPNTQSSLNNLAELYKSQGRYGEAEPLCKEALHLSEKVLGKEHPDTLRSLNNLALLYMSQERYEEAEPLYKEVLHLSERVSGKEHPDTLIYQLNYFGLMISMEKIRSAFQQIKSFEQQLLSRSFQELYSTSEERIRRLYLQSISKFQDVIFSFAQKYPETEYRQYAASVMLRWKAVYGEEYSYQCRLLNLSNDSGIKQLRKKLAKLRSDFSRQIYHPKPDVNSSVLWGEINATERIIREKAKATKPNLQVSNADISQVTSILPKGSAFVEYRICFPRDLKIGKKTKSHLAAYLLLPDSKQQLFIEDIGEVEDILKISSMAKDKQAASYQLLFSKFDKHIKDLKTLYIAPDGFLNLIPFAALKLPDGRYLAERQQINQLQTGRDLLASPSQKPSDVLIAVGGIDFGKSSDRKSSDKKGSAKNPDDIPKLNMRSGEELDGFDALPVSRKEASAIATLYKDYNSGGKVILCNDGRTTEGYLKQIVQSPRILHLSTHGFYLESESKEQWGEEEPLLLSGLALADANLGLAGMTDDKGDDGLLYAIEVAGLNLQGTELVSLSACDTGKGVVDYSEGVYGLVRAFRTAGAQSVLMTLSPVRAGESKEFMVKFYDLWLSSNLTPAEAMHKTRLHFIKENRKPEFWSPYVLVGR
jgi:CHAT domain-containing protein/Tfp pilus assembly protein PilF